MIKKRLRLFRTLMKTSDLLEIGADTKSPVIRLLKIIGFIGLLVFMAVSMGYIVQPVYGFLAPFGLQWVIIKFILLLASVLSLFTAFIFILNAFYFTSDIENQLYLPVSSGDLIISKLAIVTIYEIGSTLVFFLPAMIIYGITSRSGAVYYLKSVISLLLAPMVPMAIIGILVMLMMKNSSFFKNKERFRTLTMVVAFGAGFGIQYLMTMIFSTVEKGSFVPTALTGEGKAGNAIKLLMPPAHYLSEGFRYPEKFPLGLLITLALCIVTLVIFYLVGDRVYVDGAIGMQETSSRRKALSDRQLRNMSRGSSPLMAFAKKEIKTLARTASYMMNGLATPFILPVLFTLALYTNQNVDEGGGMTDLFRELGSRLQDPPVIFLIINILVFLNTIMNLMSPTVISREGSSFSMMKTVPQTYRKQILGRLIPSYLLLLVSNAMFIAVLQIAFGFSLKAMIPAVLFAFITQYAAIILGPIPDIISPRTQWSTETKAMKQNPNFFFVLLMVAALGAGFVGLIRYTSISINTLSYIFIGVILAIAIGVTLFLEKLATWSFNRLD